MFWEALTAAATGSATQTTPTIPGAIVAWIICNARKRNAIGGWLLFYFWQLYGTLLISVVFFALNIQSYVPENFDSGTRFTLFLCAAVPGFMLFLAQTVAATIAIGVQTRDMLILLRTILGLQIVAGIIASVIYGLYFPDNEVLAIFLLVQESLWFLYFLKSNRVRHVFVLHDWESAVNSIHPQKFAPAT
jgi:hypothetical protein